MPYLIESTEWRLLQELGCLFKSRLARLRRGSTNDHDRTPSVAGLVEVELRQVFLIEEIPQSLGQEDYDQCQINLKILCSLLENLLKPQSTSESVVAHIYPRLYTLTKSLKSGISELDLASGPQETVFTLPRDEDELENCLCLITASNIALRRLLPLVPQEPIARPLPKENKRMWKKAWVRNHATSMFETIFDHFRCGTPHEVMVKLIDDPDENTVSPYLHMALSLCPEFRLLQEVWCYPSHISREQASISSIPDICIDLHREIGQGKTLMLLIKTYGIFGGWKSSSHSLTGPQSKESLHDLILEGAFRPLNIHMLLQENPGVKFNTKDKRELAVKLGFCLMDFFDADLTSKRIHFLNSSKSNIKTETPYLSFPSKLPITSDSHNFTMGHPTLLCFAKLLLELDFGENIDISIHPQNSQNMEAYVQIMLLVERLEQERNDSYDQAFRGCLLVHHKIAKALRSSQLDRKAADAKIRKALYKEIVRRLELGLTEAIPRASHKRQRSESPPPDIMELNQVSKSSIENLNGAQNPYIPDESPTLAYQPVTLTSDTSTWFDELAKMNAIRADTRIVLKDITTSWRATMRSAWIEALIGTNIFLLLRKVSEDACFFIGRVWESNEATTETPRLMEEAIDYAREVWKVDIIVLPSGFRTTHSGIGEAIDRANMEKILVFASPSNYGNLRDIYYPGRLYGHGKVITLFSTNSMVRSSTAKTFNPSPLSTAAHRTFAILGEDIVLENTLESLNGTSYSTAIGAGIAARILDFSRHPRLRSRIKNVDDFKRVEGMLAIFGRMAKTTDNGYRCMAPWEIICPQVEEGVDRRETRERQQSAVFDEFKEAIKEIHRA
ncbi:hypothetical protein NPX13_g8432 [Xylaria arbuscula]|uniref:DUF7580 domain-containing protein n=1 Tax=Xylaria arbuscula TaxID=114810 RepID=A0A9W8TK61_9PEZI|nr:hypothetical protein NPX13_g8432 [Xylaria arbuscula]